MRARPALLAHAAPLLKALWEAQLVDEPLLLEWCAERAAPTFRRYAAPLVSWLSSPDVAIE